MPVEIPAAIPFDVDIEHSSCDAERVNRFLQALVQMDRVFGAFRSRFLGKGSPVHLFWGAFDLAVTRLSGRTAPPHPGGAPNCGPHVMHEAYSHEVSSAGYWPGPDGEGVFYSYAYPAPHGFEAAEIDVPHARYDAELGEFTLPYEAVRTASDPDELMLSFLQATMRQRPTSPAGTAAPSNDHTEPLSDARCFSPYMRRRAGASSSGCCGDRRRLAMPAVG